VTDPYCHAVLSCTDLFYVCDGESLGEGALTLKENRDKENRDGKENRDKDGEEKENSSEEENADKEEDGDEEAESGRFKLSLLFFPLCQNN
jgi:hypothetical protein